MKIQNFYDKDTATFTYVISDDVTRKCAIIDSVLNYDMNAGKISTNSADSIIAYIAENNLQLDWILETHIHADHLTASSYIKEKIGGKIAIGNKIKEVLDFWVPIFNTSKDTPLNASQFDQLFSDGEKFQIGNLQVQVIHTAGHTPACVSYLIEDAVFVGDTVFLPRMGTARTDFPGGSAKQLYASIQKIFSLPENTKIYVCHDYPESGKEPQFFCTIADQRQNNILINDKISEEEYVALRTKRDSTLSVPKLILPAIQVNLRAGKLGEPEENGVRYVKIPLNKI
jgi:glyoxylase-like metal-dependent hydrolase (beta-lactamase superfamily II)